MRSAEAPEALSPAPSPGADDALHRRRIRSMFDAVAPRYDLLNHLLSAGLDRHWRRLAVRALDPRPGERVLDLCAGTGDLGLAALERAPGLQVVGIDLAREMLARGRTKRGATSCAFVQGDAERLPLADGSVHGALVGFGIRNVKSPLVAFREVRRVLRPGGRFVVLEFTTPPRPLVRRLYHAYFHHVLPRVGRWVSGHPDAYAYLPRSVERFPDPAALAALLGEAGFSRVRWSLVQHGIAALHVARI